MLQLAAVMMAASIFAASAFPASNDKLDKATQNDVLSNSVNPSATSDVTSGLKRATESQTTISPLDKPISELTYPPPPPPPPKIRPGNMFSRFIDDVFQIPISVLQSVTKLLTNPFTQRHKDGDSA